MLLSLPDFSSSSSLSCIAHACLSWGRGALSPELILLIIRNLDTESSWWALVPVPQIAMENKVYFDLWFCFLEWDSAEGMLAIFEKRNWAGLVDRDYIYSARKMLEWTQEVEFLAERRLLTFGKETIKLLVQKAFKRDHGFEVVVGEEGAWQEPLDDVWRAIAAFRWSHRVH